MKQLLEAGVHFGHQTRRWNPKMRHFIFTERNGIHIIDLQQTVTRLDAAIQFVRDVTANGSEVLIIGTKKQARETVEMEAVRAGLPYVNNRWLGGTLTNFRTIKTGLERLKTIERMKEDGTFTSLTKKEQLDISNEIERMNRYFGGIKGMERLPAAVFIIDTVKEQIAVAECKRLNIPIVSLVDTNCDPDPVAYPIPSNDDAIRAIKLILGKMADAAIEGRAARESGAGAAVQGDEFSKAVAAMESGSFEASPEDTADAEAAPTVTTISAQAQATPAPEAAPAEPAAPAATSEE